MNNVKLIVEQLLQCGYKKINECFKSDLNEEFYASNLGTSVKYYGYDVYELNNKKEYILNGKFKIV